MIRINLNPGSSEIEEFRVWSLQPIPLVDDRPSVGLATGALFCVMTPSQAKALAEALVSEADAAIRDNRQEERK